MPQQPLLNAPGAAFVELQSVDSTNNYALARVHAGLAHHGDAYFAHEQVAGKGQRGRKWASEKGSNIALSLVISPAPLAPAQQFQLSAVVALGVRDFFARYAGDDCKIKWPNDLYWHDRKAGGILIESVIQQKQPANGVELSVPNWQWAVAGIGININQVQFPDLAKTPVSLRQITGKNWQPLPLAKELFAAVDHRWRELQENGFDGIYAGYVAQLFKKEEIVKLKMGSRVFEATIKSVSRDGRLIIQHAIEEEVESGQLEWLL